MDPLSLGASTGLYVEGACEAVTYFTQSRFDNVYDKLFGRSPSASGPTKQHQQRPSSRNTSNKRQPRYTPAAAHAPLPILASATSASAPGPKRRYKNQLPSPEPERPDNTASAPQDYGFDRPQRRESSLERESETSERVLRAYEAERTDPPRKVDTVLPDHARPYPPSNYDNMSRANGYAPEYAPRGDDGYDQRPRSQPPRSRYADDDHDSDYDDREGRRYRGGSGRGYDDDRDFDREVIETERYRGPARPADARRMDSYGERSTYEGPYGPGAVAPYRRSQGDVTEVTRRSGSRGRRDRYDRDDDRSRSRSYSDSRSRSRSKGRGFKGEMDKYFDTSAQGLGVGLAGAVAGGLAGRHFGARSKNKNRDIIIGALVGGLGANAAEHKYREWREEKEERRERDERDERGMLEPRYEGRSKSSVR